MSSKQILKRTISILSIAVMAATVWSLLCIVQPAHAVESIEYVEKSWDADSKQVVSTTKTAQAAALTGDTEYINGWCYVSGEIVNENRIVVMEGQEANIILMDGSKLTVEDGINVHWTSKLNIYTQAGGTGELICIADTNFNAAIGSNDNSGPNGPITIHGGKITADAKTEGEDGAGIGAGNTGAGGEITIYDGTIEAYGAINGAGIGAGDADGEGRDGGNITIYGGDVKAYGGSTAAGIGGGQGANGGTVTIWGGKVYANSSGVTSNGGAGIGSGDDHGTASNGGTISIHGGEVEAVGDENGAGIGGGDGCLGGNITITGGKVTATGNFSASGIGAGDDTEGRVNTGTITITGGDVEASSDEHGAGIGGGDGGGGGTINIGGTAVVKAYGGYDGAGIGGGDGGNGDNITISGGTVLAQCKKSASPNTGAAGIGGGDGGKGSNINITGGTITEAKGGNHGAGIGGGDGGLWDTITITGGTVNATGGSYAAGIGGGNKDSGTVSNGTINISGGTVNANGGVDGAGIGGGECTTGGTINISGGTVTANALANTDNACGAGIGGGDEAGGGTITISGGHVDATGGVKGAGIGNGESGDDATNIIMKYAEDEYDISVKATSYRYNDENTSVTLKMENPFMDKDTRESFSVANYTGNDLNQFKNKTLIRGNTYGITVSEMQNGSVAADKKRGVPESTIMLTVTPDAGYELKSGTLKATAGETEIAVTQDASDPSKYTFTMPQADVVIKADFIQRVPVESVTLNKETTTLAVDDTETLTATVSPEATDTTVVDKTVTWKSSDESVATVDGTGKVTAVAAGEATITATATNGTEDKADDKTATCTVTVNKVEVAVPTIVSKVYNGEPQTADVPESDLYEVTKNEGGTNVGTYDVVLTLNDTNKYKWTDSEDAARTLAFEITKATPPEVVVPTLEAVTYDPARTLADVELPAGWTWMDNTAVPTVGNNGYQAALTVDDANYDYTGVEGYDAETHKVMRTVPLTVNKPKPEPKPQPAPAKVVSGTLMAKSIATGRNSLNISWTRVQNADGYDIFLSRCDAKDSRKTPKRIKTIKGNKTFKWTKGKLARRTAYKGVVKAYVIRNGKKIYVRTSPLVHAFTNGYRGDYTNPRSVTVAGKAISLKKGKSFKIQAKVNKLKKNKRLISRKHAPTLRYMTSNSRIAVVNGSGRITARGTGNCTVYVYAANGVCNTVKVRVK